MNGEEPLDFNDEHDSSLEEDKLSIQSDDLEADLSGTL